MAVQFVQRKSGIPDWVFWARSIKTVAKAWDKKVDDDADEDKVYRALAVTLINKHFPVECVAELLRYRMDLPTGEAADPEDRAFEIATAMWEFVYPDAPADPAENLGVMDPEVVKAMMTGMSNETRLKLIARLDERVRAAMWVDVRDSSICWDESDEAVNALLTAAAFFRVKRALTGVTRVSPQHFQMLSIWIERVYGIPSRVSDANIEAAFGAMLRKRHPIQEMLLRLVTPREDESDQPSQPSDSSSPLLDTWLTRVFGAEDNALMRAFGRKWLIQAVARVFEPGCTAKGVLSLVGMQDAGKSTALEYLAYEWAVTLPTDLGDKDSRLNCHRGWIIELAELAGLKKASIEAMKTFLSEKVDTLRAPYERVSAAYPRSFVFATTTNDVEFLRDATGNVRFWIVRVTKRVDFDDLMAIRDQLWREATLAYLEDRAAVDADPRQTQRAWYLTEDERTLQAIHNGDYEPEDETGARIRAIALRLASVARRPLPDRSGAVHYCTSGEILRELQAQEPSHGSGHGSHGGYGGMTHVTTAFGRLVAGALISTHSNTWRQIRVMADNVKTRYYLPPADELARIHASQVEARRIAQEVGAKDPGLKALLDLESA